jgi:hypothetical protein
MRTLTVAMFVVAAIAVGPAMAQQSMPNQNLQNEADKGVKTENSGASGFVADQEKPGAAAHPPGQPDRATSAIGAGAAPSAPNSGAGIGGAPGNKNGPPAGTVGSSSSNLSVQQQDSSNVKGLPGNKSGPPAKR